MRKILATKKSEGGLREGEKTYGDGRLA